MTPEHRSNAVQRGECRRIQFIRTLAVALLLSVGFSPASTFAQQKGSDSGYRSFLWLRDASKPGPELFRALDELGVSGTNVAGTASSAAHAGSARPFYMDHVAGKGTLHLKDESFLEPWEAWKKTGARVGLERPLDLFAPDVLRRARARIDQVLEPVTARKEALRPFGLSLDDEISFGRRSIPVDFGFSPGALTAFRGFLRDRYKTPENLAKAWRIPVTPFEQVRPLSTAEIRKREFIRDPLEWNFAPWAEHRAFLDQAFTEIVGNLARHARDMTGGIPTGFTGGTSPSPFSGVDWARMLEVIDFCEPYDVGGSRELVRSFARPRTRILRTVFRDPRGTRANVHELWDYFLRGDNGCIIWSSREYFEKSERPRPWARELAPTLKQLSRPELQEWIQARPRDAEIAIIESQASNRAHWLLDSRLDGSDWSHRYGTWARDRDSQNRTREAWQKLLEDLHLDYVHLSEEQLGRVDLSRFKVLVLPRTIALSDAAVKVIRQFAKTRTVIADCQCALFDENLVARPEGALDDLFGISRENLRVRLKEEELAQGSQEQANKLLLAEPGLKTTKQVAATLRIDGRPCMIFRRQGTSGRSIYLNLLIYNYLDARRLNKRIALLDDLRGVFRTTGVRPFCEVRTKGVTPPVRLHHRVTEDADYIAVIWNWRQSARPLDARALNAMQPIDIEVLLPRASVIRNLITDENASPLRRKYPRRLSSIVGTLSPFEPLIYKLPRRDDVRNR